MSKIFLVEDDDGIRELIEYLLISLDYEVQAFPNAQEFHKELKSQNPDLILLDVMLPDGNGINICRKLNDNIKTKEIPVILMSAHENIAKGVCASDFLSKPFEVDDLIQKVKNQL